MPICIDRLEVDRCARGNLKGSRAVFVHRRFSQDDFNIPCGQVADRRRPMLSTDIRGHEVQRDDSDFFHSAPSNPFESRTSINVLNGKSPGLLTPVRGIGRLRRKWPRGQGDGLVAGNGRIGSQKYAFALLVHEVNSKPLLPLGPECHQVVFLIQGIRILPLISVLPVLIDSYRAVRLFDRSNQGHSACFFSTLGRVDDGQLPALVGMVPGENGQNFPRVRNASGMENCRGKVGVVSIIPGLLRAVRIHLEQRLEKYLTAVVVFPTCVRNQPAPRVNLGIVGMYLIDSNPAHLFPVLIHQVHIAHAHVPAVNVLNTARGTEHDVATRQIDPFIISESLAESELADFPSLKVHFIQMIIFTAG